VITIRACLAPAPLYPPLNALHPGSGKLKEYEMNPETSELIRKCCSYVLEPTYRRGLAWAISKKDVFATSVHLDHSVYNDELSFSEAELTTLRNNIHNIVNDVDVFDPNSEFRYYEVAFAIGLTDGIKVYKKLDKLLSPRFAELRGLLEREIRDGCAAPIVSSPTRSGPPKLSLVWSAPQGSIQ